MILWRSQEIEAEGQIYDKMSDGDVNSSKRLEVCEHAVASISLRPKLLDQIRLLFFFLFIAFISLSIDGKMSKPDNIC